MHNLKEIRKNFDAFEKELKKRTIDINFSQLKKLDIQNREFIQKKENLEKEKKDISKSKDKSLFAKSKELSISLEEISKKQNVLKSELEKFYPIYQIFHILMFQVEKMRMIMLKLVNLDKFLILILNLSHIMSWVKNWECWISTLQQKLQGRGLFLLKVNWLY